MRKSCPTKDLKLSDAKFSDASGQVNGPDGLPVDGTWEWKSPDPPLHLGENPNCVAVFVPAADPDSYNELTYSITVTVTKGFHAMISKLVEIPVGTTEEITVDLTEDLADVTATGIKEITSAENKLVASHHIDGLTVKITPRNTDTVDETDTLTATVTSTEYYGFSVSIVLKVVAPKKVPATAGTKAVTVTYGDEVDDQILNDGTVLTAAPTEVKVGETVKLSVSGGTTQGPVTYTVDPSENAVVGSKGVLTAKKAGTTQVTATMAGNENYNAVNSAPVTVTIKPDETKPTSAIVTFEVVNGYFSCTGGRYQTEYQLAVTLTYGKGTLGTQYIPTPYLYSGYGYGRWDVVPNTNANGITGDVTYTYCFDPYYYPPVIPVSPVFPAIPWWS